MQQDTVSTGRYLIKESIRVNTFSLPAVRQFSSKEAGKQSLHPATNVLIPSWTDTTSVCTRNSIADVTFYDSKNIVFNIESGTYKQFPYLYTEQAMQRKLEEKTLLVKHLKSGNDMPAQPLHTDWMIIILLVAAFLFSLVRSTSKSMFPYFERFFMLRGKISTTSRDSGGLFNWQSTIMNLLSFLIIGLFVYSVVSYYNFMPSGSKGIMTWLIGLLIISSAVTVRHLLCVITGVVSGQQEVFREYLLGIYQSYRFGAIFLFAFIILMSYTVILPDVDYIIAGIIIIGLVYFIRVIRLVIIFLNRSISIFYLILYLCALEILPVLILVKYFTGLI